MSKFFTCLVAFVCVLFSLFSQSQSPGISSPGDFFSFVESSLLSGSPEIGEWTRTAGPDESIVLTGYKLSSFSGNEEGKDSRFMVYGSGGTKKEAKIQRLDGDKAILTLDKDMPSWSMYLLQPGNDAGWGKAVAINKTDAWWVQDKAAVGMTVSVFGRNLAHGNVEGSSNSHVYLKSSATGAGQWASVTKVNPYKVDFTLPSSITADNYEGWVHNGHGGEWGWSGPLKLQVVASSEHILAKSWGTVYNVKTYGARGDGQSDDRSAINQALAAAASSGATVYFPSGTYMVSGALDLKNNTRWLGDKDSQGGAATSIIKLRAGFVSGTFGLVGGNNPTLNLFENLKLDRNNQDLSNHELVDMRGAQMVWWKNCEIDARGDNAVRLQGSGSSYIYLTDSEFTGGEDQWGNVIYIDGLRQFFADRCTFKMTRDCGAAIMNRGIIESSVTGSTIQDLDNTTTDGSGWGKGRIWSSIGAAGAQYHQYLASNIGKGLGTRRSGSNLPDNNSGEIFLWEANSTMFSGYPASAGSNTVNFSSAVPNTDWLGVPRIMGLTIIEGKGAGQFRLIMSQSGGALKVDRPWGVIPDGSSKILVGPYVGQIVLYKNSLDANGKPYIANNSWTGLTASVGIEPYGGCFDFVADGNIMQGITRGISLWATDHGMVDPSYFHLFVNNKMVGCRMGIYNGSPHVEQNKGTALLGAVYRKNIVQQGIVSAVQNDTKYASSPVFKAFVYEGNSFQAPAGFQTGSMYQQNPDIDYGSGAWENQVFYKNTFSGLQTAIRMTPNVALRENTYQGFASTYKGTSTASSTIIEAPYHVVEINAGLNATVKAPFTLHNAGTAALNWSISENATWLSLSKTGGTIVHEGENDLIELSANTHGLATGTHKVNLAVSANGVTENYTVLLKTGNKTSSTSARMITFPNETTEEVSINKEPLKEDQFSIYPNPSKDQTTIEFALAESSKVSLQIYDRQGALVKTIYKGNINGGTLNRFPFDAKNLASGVYFCRLVADKKTLQQKIVLVK